MESEFGYRCNVPQKRGVSHRCHHVGAALRLIRNLSPDMSLTRSHPYATHENSFSSPVIILVWYGASCGPSCGGSASSGIVSTETDAGSVASSKHAGFIPPLSVCTIMLEGFIPCVLACCRNDCRNASLLFSASLSALPARKNASGARKKAVREIDAVSADTAANNKIPWQSPFESKIVDDEAELLTDTAEGWDLVRDLPGERFLIRRKVPKL